MKFNISQFIHFPIFAISFFIGVFIIYFVGLHQMRKIYVYPTPETVDALQYKDSANNCFTVKHTQVRCPANADAIKKIPVAI